MLRVLVLLTAVLMGCAQRQPPLEATQLWENEALYVGVAVPDSGRSPSLVLMDDDRYVQLSNLRLQPVMSTPFRNRGTFQPGDMAGAAGRMVWATCRRHDSLFVVDVLRRHEMFVTSGVDREPPAGWDGRIRDVFLRDINADGKMEAVVVVWSGFDTGGRGIYVLDWASGELRWSYRIGPSPANVLLRDMDGDGKTEILAGTIATGNGDTANGTDDFHTYVLLLNADGSLRWIRQIGNWSSAVAVSWLSDSTSLDPSILAVEMGFPAGDRACDSVFVLDSRDDSITARARYGTYNTMQAVVSDKVGMSVLLGGADDTMRCLDPVTLKPRNKAAMPCGVSSPSTIGGNSIGSGLAVVPTTDGRLLVISPSPRVECAIASGAAQGIHPVAGTSVPTFLAEGVTGGRQVWRLYSLAPTPVLRRPVTLATLLGALLATLAAFGLALAAVRYRQTRDLRVVVRGLTGQAGVIEVDNRGRVRHTNARARGLLGGDSVPAGPLSHAVKTALAEPPGSTPKELPVALDGGKTVLARAARVRSGVMLTLEDISAVEYLQRVKAWAPVAQKLAHGIKNPLGTIMGAVEQIEAEVNRRGMKAEGGSKEPKAKSEDGTRAEARGQKLEARSRDSETGTPEPVNPGTPTPSDERVQKYVGYVKDEVTRLKKMTDAFMRFTKLNPPALESKSINELVRKVAAKYEGTLAKGISLDLSLDEQLPLVALDEEGIANVLDIVVENAVEAMSGEVGSRQNAGHRGLKIRTRFLDSPHGGSLGMTEANAASPTQTGLGVLGGSHVRIEIEDTGMGIPQKYLDKVFEPYFTYGKADGTGLGLALAKKIVEDHKGRMEIRSQEGTGTTVTIVLPVERRADA